jgi:F0F1-type ATP synthase membrane subunit c/vacuolar-type H+-ATPase subunit K
MDPVFMALVGVGLAIGGPVVAAAVTIIICGSANAGIGIHKPKLLSRLIITIVLGEALAIYGLLIGFMLLSKLPTITTADAGNKAFMAGIIMAVAAISAGAGISYSGSSLAGAALEREETFSSNVISVVLSEALAIYGLLIAFILIGQI